ncbi:MAG: permease [Treponema sp.]|nr:permease [Treponema sp.]
MLNYIFPFIVLVNEMSPFLLLGFLIAGFLKVYVPKEKYIGHIAKPDFSSVLWATFAGIPLPFCSCSVIPMGSLLNREGASKGATVSFLTSIPQTNIQSIMVTYSLLGLPFAVIRPIAAIISSFTGGITANKLDKKIIQKNNIEIISDNNKDQKKILQAIHYGFVEMLQDIGKWLLFGIIFAGVLAIFLPEDLFSTYLNNPLLNMLIVLLVALPTYTCAVGSIPMAAVLLMKGLSPGAAFVFLMAGPVTSIASMTIIGKTMGKKILIIYIVNIVVNALAFGLIIDYLIPSSWLTMSIINNNLLCDSGIESISVFNSICSIIFIGLIINAYIQKYISEKKKNVKPCCCNNE